MEQEITLEQLRHAYYQLLNNNVEDQYLFAKYLLGPIIEEFEQYTDITNVIQQLDKSDSIDYNTLPLELAKKIDSIIRKDEK